MLSSRPDISIATVSMVKNELDVIHLFCSHVCAIADRVIIVDHLSDDGTEEYLRELEAERPEVTVLRYEEPSYDQALLMNEIVRNLPTLDHVDWVLLLDADEFVPVDVDIRSLIRTHADSPGLSFGWRNTPLVSYDQSVIRATTEVWVGPKHGHHNTIAVNVPLLRGSSSWIDQGNHVLLTHRYGRPRRLKQPADILHLPLRSWEQFAHKVDQGVAAYEAQGVNRNPNHGTHWTELKSLGSTNGLNDGHVHSIVLGYGASGARATEIHDEELVAMGFTRATLPIHTDETIATVPEQDINNEQRPPRALAIEDGKIRRADEAAMRFGTLDPAPAYDTEDILSDDEFVLAQLDPAVWAISDLTPTAWGGHIPFMFTMFGMHRPQRYVELGSHYGASFFAACQASERLMIDTECVAIDTWAGDDHTGVYENDVFKSFCSIVDRRNYTNARMLRMFFDEAVEQFEDGSVDLLHIDGLHTYEAVRHDFETWLPKMAPGGIVLFHDTNVHERDFGVWRLWNELNNDYLGFEFRHAHGLGVLVVEGGPQENVSRFISILNKRPRLAEFVQHHFESLAPRIVAEARIRYAEQQTPNGDVGEFIRHAAGVEEERTRLALNIGALRRERDDLQRRVHELENAEREAHRRNSPFVLVKSSVGRTRLGKKAAPLYRHLTRGS